MANQLDEAAATVIDSEQKHSNENDNSKQTEGEIKIPTVIIEDESTTNLSNSQKASPIENSKFMVEKAENKEEGLTKNLKSLNQPEDLDENASNYIEFEHNQLPDGDFQSAFSASEYPEGLRGETIVDHLPVPPDGGYGWIIVAAAFVSNLIVDGISNSFGPFMRSYQETFNSTKATTSIIGALLIGSYLLSGPIAGGLLNKYEAQKVVIGGSLLAATAFVISTFSPNIVIHFIIYGLFGGIGFGFIYLPAIVAVSQYFEKKRALATGIAVSGSGFGTFVMPLVCKFLIEEFGWRVTLYFLAGAILICALCGMFYKSLPVPEDQIRLNEEIKQQALFAALSRADFSQDGDDELCEFDDDGATTQAGGDSTPYKRECNRTNSQCTNRTSYGQTAIDREDDQPLLPQSQQNDVVDDVHTATTPPPRTQLSPITENRGISKNKGNSQQHSNDTNMVLNRLPQVMRNRKTTLTSINSEFTSIANGMDFRNSRPNLTSQLSRISARSYAQSLSRISQAPHSIKAGDSVLSVALSGVDPKEFNRPMSRRDIFLQGSIRNLKEFEDEGCNYKAYREQHSVSIPTSVLAQSLSKISIANVGTSGDIAELSSRMGGSRYSRITGGFGADDEEDLAVFAVDESKLKWIPYPIRNAFSEMIDVNLLHEPVMLLLCLSNILGMIGFYVPFVYVIDLAAEKNIHPSQGTLLLSIIGITNTFGRIFFGWITDKQWFSALMLNNWSLISCGLLTVACPWAANFTGLVIYACFFGFIVSAYICLTSIVLSDLLGVERLTNSFGLLIVSRGVASLLGTPLAGIVYDFTSSYNASFYFSGTLIILSGLVSCLIPILHRHERSKYKNEGDYHYTGGKGADADPEAQSGKLSVLTEHSEENLTEYQRTIQSLAQQKQLIRELEEYKRKSKQNNVKLGEKNEVFIAPSSMS